MGKALHIAILLIPMLKNSLLAALVMLDGREDGCQFSCERKSAAEKDVGWPFIRF